MLHQLGSVGGRSVSAADPHGWDKVSRTTPLGHRANASDGAAQIPLDINAQCFQGRDIEDSHTRHVRFGAVPEHDPIDRHQERCECLAGTCRGKQQSMVTLVNLLPCLVLCIRRFRETLKKPLSNQGVEGGKSINGCGTAGHN